MAEDFKPFVPEESTEPEFTLRAVLLGVIMAIILGAANAYLGLKAGMTVAATFPAAVVSMAVLRILRGSVLEENMSRTIASVGEALVAGAIFTLPAFYIAGVWEEFGGWGHYFESTAIMIVGGVIGVLFVTILRQIMVVESDLPFPESIAAAEIHKASRTGGTGAKYLFGAMIVGGLIELANELHLYAARWKAFIPFFKEHDINVGSAKVTTGGGMLVATPKVSTAYVGVGFIIGPKLSTVAFSGGVLAWALFVPLLMFFLMPNLQKLENKQAAAYMLRVRPVEEAGKEITPEQEKQFLAQQQKSMDAGQITPEIRQEFLTQKGIKLSDKATITAKASEWLVYGEPAQIKTQWTIKDDKDVYPIGKISQKGKENLNIYSLETISWEDLASWVWQHIVRYIAVGGMLVGAVYTLYKMRKQLLGGLARAIGDIGKAATQDQSQTSRLQKDLNFKWIFISVGVGLVMMAALYYYFCGQMGGAIISTLVMAIAGFFFAAVAGYLVGLIGSSNNPISGLTLSTLIIAALLMVAIGVSGNHGIAAVLGVAAVVCCMCGVAGDMLQDLKVGHILGGTPWKMELGEIIGVIAAALVMFLPLMILHAADIKQGGIGFGSEAIPAPQAGLMAMLSKGIMQGNMPWALVIIGMFMAIGLIMVGSPSPMLIAVGMYLPLETTFTIFLGGVIRWILDFIVARRSMDEAQVKEVENTGVLLASGFIAGEALTGIILATLKFIDIPMPHIFSSPSIWVGMGVLGAYAASMIFIPLNSAKKLQTA